MGWGPTLSRPQALPLAATSGWPDGVRQGCLGEEIEKEKALGLSKVAEVVCIKTCPGMAGVMGIKMTMMIPDLLQHFSRHVTLP